MGYWGWRPLIYAVFISVWVVGCTITATEIAPTLSPTNTPQITLTVRTRAPRPPTLAPQSPTMTPTQAEATPLAARLYTVRPGDTLLGIALDLGVEVAHLQTANPGIDPLQLQVGQQIIIPYSLPSTLSPLAAVSLSLSPPACYELPTGRVLCLGQVINHQPFPVEHVRVRVQILDSGLIAERTVGVERRIIWPGESAPYGAFFNVNWNDRYIVSASLHMAQAARPDEQRNAQVVIEDERVERQNGRYMVSLMLYNPSATATRPMSLTLTLLDSEGRVAGYRVKRIAERLAAGSRTAVHIEAISQLPNAELSHVLYVEESKSA